MRISVDFDLSLRNIMAHIMANIKYILVPFACVLPTGNAQANFAKLSLLSLLFTTFFLFIGDFAFPGGAHLFLMYAEQLLHGGQLPANVSQRDAGYPLLMVLTGVPQTGSFLLLALVQAFFSFLMPLLIFRIVEHFDTRAAYWAGFLAIASLGPYQFMKWIHHDQPYLFFSILGCYMFSRFIYSGKRSHFLWMGAVFVLMSITRPAGNWIYLILLFVSIFSYPKMWRFFVLNLAGFIVFLSLYQAHREAAFGVDASGRMPSYSGIQILYNLIIKSDDFGVTITPDTSPNVRVLYDMTLAKLQPSLEKSEFLKGFLSSTRPSYSEEFYKLNFTGMTSEQLAHRIFSNPNYEYVQLLSGAGKFDQDFLYMAAAKDIVQAHPMFVLQYVARSTWHMLANPGYSDTRGNNNNMGQEGVFLLPFGHVIGNQTSIPPRGLKELEYSAASTVFSFTATLRHYMSGIFANSYRSFVFYTFPFALFATLCSVYYLMWVRIFHKRPPAIFAGILDDNRALVVIGITGVHLYNCLVTAAFVDPSIRYHFFVLLFHTTLTAMGGYIIWMIAMNRMEKLCHKLCTVRLPIDYLDKVLSRRATYSYIVLSGMFIIAAWLLHIQTALKAV